MRKYKGFTLTELLIAAMIIGTVALSITSYLIFAKKKVSEVKHGIDRYNLSQSILTEIQSWEYRGSGIKTLTSLKSYLDDNSYDYLKFLKKLADSGDKTGLIYNIQSKGGGLFLLDTVVNSYYKVRVVLEFAQEDVADLDNDGITTELIYSNTDNGIMRITVQTAIYDEKIVASSGENALPWATAIGYKGVSMVTPAIDFVIFDPTAQNLTPTSQSILLGFDFRKTAAMNNGFSHLKTMHEFDLDETDQNGDKKYNYKDGGFWEADSDNMDNDGDGIIDNVREQNHVGTAGKLRCVYDFEIFSPEPFTFDLSDSKVRYGVFITDKTGLALPTPASLGEWKEIKGWFEEVSGSNKTHYKNKNGNQIKVSNTGSGAFNPSNDIYANGTYTVCVIARTNPGKASGYTMVRTYPIIVDTQAPILSDVSPPDGYFNPTSTVTLSARAEDVNNLSKLSMVYVFKKRYEGGGYTWDFMQSESIDGDSAKEKTFAESHNIGISVKNVPFGWHEFRLVVTDRAGNAAYGDRRIYVSPVGGDDAGNKTGDGRIGTGVVGGLRVPGYDANESLNFPVIQPLSPWDMKAEIALTQSNLISTYGTTVAMPKVNDTNPRISILLLDSDMSAGIQTQSGILVDRSTGWPKIFYKTYGKDDIVEPSIWSASGVNDATSVSNFIPYDNNNIIVQFSPGEVPKDGKVQVGVQAKDHSGNISQREWIIQIDSTFTEAVPQMSNVLLFQLANHPNWIAPFPYNPNWSSSNNDIENKNFYFSISAAGANPIKSVTLYYTEIFDPLNIPSTVAVKSQTKNYSIESAYYAGNFGFTLSDLDLSSPGVFMYYVQVTDHKNKVSYFYNSLVTFPYYRESIEAPTETAKNILMPITNTSAPVSAVTGTSLTNTEIVAAMGKWISVPVSRVRVLMLNMDTSSSADKVGDVYTDPSSAFYWNSSSSDFKMIKVDQNISPEYLKGLIDKNSNDKFDDYDIVIMFTGDTTSPPGFDEGVIVHLHRWLMSPAENDVYRGLDNDVFYPWDGVGRGVSPYYSSSVAPRIVFIGKRFFNVTRNGSSPWSLWEAFTARWAGLDPSTRQEYDVAVNPYVVSNLRFAYDVNEDNKLDDTLFGHFLGQVVPQWKSDGTLDIETTDTLRKDINNYQIKLPIAHKAPVVDYDGEDTNSIDGPYRWKLMGENFPKEQVQPAASSGLTVPVDITTNIPNNPSVHNGSVAPPFDYYKYAARWSLVFGDNLEDLGFTAGTWVYKGRLMNGKWDYRIRDNERDTINTKVLYLGFGIESVATKNLRYVMMKRIIRFMYY